MSRALGPLLTATGIGHFVVGIALFQEPLAAMLRDGLVNSVGGAIDMRTDAWLPVVHPDYDREAAFWFLVLSPVLVMLAQVSRHAAAHRDSELVTTIGRYLMGLGLVGVAVMPVSGFWIVLALGVLALRTARDRRCQATLDAGAAPDRGIAGHGTG
jgi:hypothetical protein